MTRFGAALLRERDLLNAQLGDWLPMTVARSDALFWLVAEGGDFAGLAMAQNAAGYASFGDHRRTDQEFLTVVRKQHAVEDDLLIWLAREPIQANNVAFLDP